MLGYMTKQEAKELGFTHYGNYYFIPVYFGLDPEYGFCCLAKWFPLTFLMPAVTALEKLMWKITMQEGDFVCYFRSKGIL